jgi:WhiB family redox-sensing transcriptional regulator
VGVDLRWVRPVDGTQYAWVNPFEGVWHVDDVCDINSWRWAVEAACSGSDPESFFETETKADRDYLARICEPCPVRQQCLEHALIHDEAGWWGGTSRRERRELMEGTDGPQAEW